jgi:hypothetical protein
MSPNTQNDRLNEALKILIKFSLKHGKLPGKTQN